MNAEVPEGFHDMGLFGDPIIPASRGAMSDAFLIPPFSVLNAREGWWQDRKRRWLSFGIKSELGRGDNALGESEGVNERHGNGTGNLGRSNAPGGSPRDAATLGANGKTVRGDGVGRPLHDGAPCPGGGTGKNSAFLFRTEGGDSPLRELQEDAENGSVPAVATPQPSLFGEQETPGDPSTVRAARSGPNGGWSAHPRYYEQKIAAEKRLGRDLETSEFERDHFVIPDESEVASGTSIFDPVICELSYRWFCPYGGQVLDPFCGGSVRGIMAAMLGRRYWGCDLRAEQVAANEAQGRAIVPECVPSWVCGDAREVVSSAPEADFVFSCPPYGDLERYSDDPADLSTMEYPAFVAALREVVAGCYSKLRPNRFSSFVVGEFRDKRGHYRNFVGDTVEAFRAAGFEYYNEAILITMVGSLPVRAGKQFKSGRKLGRTHQAVLTFVKGDWRKASAACEGE